MRSADRARVVLESMGDLTDLAGRLDALSDVNRLRLAVAVHAAPGQRVSDLAALTGLSLSATSHALRVLRSTGFVVADRAGREKRYRIADPAGHDLLHALGAPHGPGVAHADAEPSAHVVHPAPDEHGRLPTDP